MINKKGNNIEGVADFIIPTKEDVDKVSSNTVSALEDSFFILVNRKYCNLEFSTLMPTFLFWQDIYIHNSIF